MVESPFAGESSVVRAEREDKALKEIFSTLQAQRTLTIAEIAAISQKYLAEPARILEVLEASRRCKVDWASQQVVCR